MDLYNTLHTVWKYHPHVWLRCAGLTGSHPAIRSSDWKGATLVSASGRILAFQTGHCCEWQLTVVHCAPADWWDENDREDDLLMDEGFLNTFLLAHAVCIVQHNP